MRIGVKPTLLTKFRTQPFGQPLKALPQMKILAQRCLQTLLILADGRYTISTQPAPKFGKIHLPG